MEKIVIAGTGRTPSETQDMSFVSLLPSVRKQVKELASKDSKMSVTMNVLVGDKIIGSVSFDMDL